MQNDPTDPNDGLDKLARRIRARSAGLSKALLRVLHYIDENRVEAMTKSAVEIGAAIGTSDATVIRTIQALGFNGLKDLKAEIAKSFGLGHTAVDHMARTFSTISEERATPIQTVLRDHREGFEALCLPDTQLQIEAAVNLLAKARHIGVFGIGPTGHLAGYFALQLSRSGRLSRAFDGHGSPLPDQLLHMPEVDALVMLTYGRPNREAQTCLSEARRLRKPVVLITDSPDKRLASEAKAVVAVHRGEAGRVALHGATFVCLEAIVLALASLQQQRALETLERLNELRRAAGKVP